MTTCSLLPLPIPATASCKSTITMFYLLSYHLILLALGLHTVREEPQGLEDILQISSVYIHISKIPPRQTQISRNTLWMAELKDLRRILLSLIGLSAPPELRHPLLCQSSCQIITGPAEQGTERWTENSGQYQGRAVLPTGSCISPVDAKL